MVLPFVCDLSAVNDHSVVVDWLVPMGRAGRRGRYGWSVRCGRCPVPMG